MKNKSTLQTIFFSELFLWDVTRFNIINKFKNENFLKDILNLYKILISKTELIQNDWKIIYKISHQGELFFRYKEQISTYKGRLYKVLPNSIIYSKMGVKHGGIYYHGAQQLPFAVSAEYPTFTFLPNKINGEYLTLVFRSSQIKKLLNTKLSGSSRRRVQVDEFLNIQIPLPPLEEQNKIVESYNKGLLLKKEADQAIEKAKQEVENLLLKNKKSDHF
uniref:Type I restriction modification DNA specificity domain-containing protein n=1 Tax=Pseudochlorodesmis sp. HV01306a TaxID=2358488 RepID=A0A386AY54_9CHLO|nr:hypothetical protein [Pseudochlorodesmis sp. HV01306a]